MDVYETPISRKVSIFFGIVTLLVGIAILLLSLSLFKLYFIDPSKYFVPIFIKFLFVAFTAFIGGFVSLLGFRLITKKTAKDDGLLSFNGWVGLGLVFTGILVLIVVNAIIRDQLRAGVMAAAAISSMVWYCYRAAKLAQRRRVGISADKRRVL